MAGGEFIGFSNATFLSEKSEADRNFAIGYYLKEAGVFPEGSNLKETLDLYFQLCSVEANCDSAAVISATIANGGVCPTTGEVMFMCVFINCPKVRLYCIGVNKTYVLCKGMSMFYLHIPKFCFPML